MLTLQQMAKSVAAVYDRRNIAPRNSATLTERRYRER